MNTEEIKVIYPVKIANTYWKRALGLLLYNKPFTQQGLLIIPCNSIHMFFMRFDIDVVFLDPANRAVKCVSEIKPWRVVPPVKGAVAALELPAGTISRFRITNGNKVMYNEQTAEEIDYEEVL